MLIIFCECVVNSLYKLRSRFDIREDIDFEQRKVGLLYGMSTMNAASSALTSYNER